METTNPNQEPHIEDEVPAKSTEKPKPAPPELAPPRYVQIQSRPCSCSHSHESLLDYANFGLNLAATIALIWFIVKLFQISKKFV